nr:unnamed protein product [Callosobruchus analis]
MLQIKYYPGEGYNLQYMPDYRFYCDEKILRPLSSYYDYPFRTRVWIPYGKWRVYCEGYHSELLSESRGYEEYFTIYHKR